MSELFILPCGCHINEGHIWGIEYSIANPNHHDGVSEWRCEKHEKRFGRWSMKELMEGESEKKAERLK